MSGSSPFIYGLAPKNPGPLARFLPPIPEGIVRAWLKTHLPPGSWVLDPFGSSPRLVIEAAQAGFRVLVAANNPIARFLIEMAANPPSEADLRPALAELAASHRGNERIEPHIRSLYETECAHCGQTVMAEYFLWERQAAAPYARSYHCPYCGDAGERPTRTQDMERATQFASSGLHRARALERVTPLDDPDRPHVEEALSVYLPRAVYALFTIINKLDGSDISPARQNYLRALLLTACDQANTLWPHPTVRERPRQLTIPPHFRENNIWLALEQSIQYWILNSSPVPLTMWPKQPLTGSGISLFEGRLKDLAVSLPAIKIGAVITALPRPNQAFWTLSALWAGWLWGKEAVGPFKNVLRRRRYDWAWHTAALTSAMANLASMVTPDTPFWGLIGEAEPGFISSVLIAAEITGFELEDLALRADVYQAQIAWRWPTTKSKATEGELYRPTNEIVTQVASQSSIDYLRERGQPSPYLPLHTSAVAALIEIPALHGTAKAEDTPQGSSSTTEPSPTENFNQIQGILKDAFTYRRGFVRYGGSEQSLDVGYWWLRDEGESKIPLSDRVEVALVDYLQKHPGCTLIELDRALCTSFPGLLTPDLELIQVCLDSYGEQSPPESGRWDLRSQDTPSVRHADLDTMNLLVKQLGEQLGFFVEKRNVGQNSHAPQYWLDSEGQVRYIFYTMASATFGEIVLDSRNPVQPLLSTAKVFIALPGGRSNLVAYKLHSDPHLKKEVDQGWHFIKYRHLRRLVESPLLIRDTLDEQLDLDPLTYTAPQLRLL